jgi:hypothetical protein
VSIINLVLERLLRRCSASAPKVEVVGDVLAYAMFLLEILLENASNTSTGTDTIEPCSLPTAEQNVTDIKFVQMI